MAIGYQKPSSGILNHFKAVRKIDMPLVKGMKAKTSKVPIFKETLKKTRKK